MNGSRKSSPPAARGSRGCAINAQGGPVKAELRLRAEDAEDLAVISACLQDALVAVRDLAYDREARVFVLVANRFRWESGAAVEGTGRPFERTLCGLAFDEVDGVVYRGFHRSEEDRILSLLAIRPLLGPTGGAIDLEFAGGATIRLTATVVRCRLRDFGEPWPTVWQPGHPLDPSG
jgi:hypothetical protein